MTCQELDQRLDEWLDGALSPSDAAEVEAHLAACDACRESARKLRQVLAHAAALPRSVAPARDLWPGIESRISRTRDWSGLFGWGPMLAAAAALVVVFLGSVVWRQQSKGIVRTVEMPAASPARIATVSATAPEAGVADPALAQAERDYEAATNALLEALQHRKRALQPEMLAGVEADLQLIDRALTEVRRALVKDPHNAELNRMLVSTHRKKVDVLRRVVRLSTAL
jgi:predicted anti-sigma-YlaC factor YlaD